MAIAVTPLSSSSPLKAFCTMSPTYQDVQLASAAAMSSASKMYIGHSCVKRYPWSAFGQLKLTDRQGIHSPPVTYSATRNMFRTVTSPLTMYSVTMYFCQLNILTVPISNLSAFPALRWKIAATTKKNPNTMSCMTKPASMMYLPRFFVDCEASVFTRKLAPAACTRKHNISPPRKIFVSHVGRMMEALVCPDASTRRPMNM